GVFTRYQIALAFVAYAAVFFVVCHHCPWRIVRGVLLAVLLGGMVVVTVMQVTHEWVLLGYQEKQFVAFATNVALLRFYAYAWRHTGDVPGDFSAFLVAMSFFPTFMNGPIETYEDVLAHRDPRFWGDAPARLAWLREVGPGAAGRLLCGTAKYVLAA